MLKLPPSSIKKQLLMKSKEERKSIAPITKRQPSKGKSEYQIKSA